MKIFIICNNSFWDNQYLITDLERTNLIIANHPNEIKNIVELFRTYTGAYEIIEFDEMEDITDLIQYDENDWSYLTKEQLREKAKFLTDKYLEEYGT